MIIWYAYIKFITNEHFSVLTGTIETLCKYAIKYVKKCNYNVKNIFRWVVLSNISKAAVSSPHNILLLPGHDDQGEKLIRV